MPYQFLEHTGDWRLKVTAKSCRDLFREALRGMMSFLKKEHGFKRLSARGSHGDGLKRIRRLFKVTAGDSTSLLVDFLNEVLAVSQIYKEIYDQIVFRKFSANLLEVEVRGWPVESFDEDIKAVTYHEAFIEKTKKGKWVANLVFDV